MLADVTGGLALSRYQLLSVAQCDSVYERVMSLRPDWVERGERQFYSLGTAAYLDAPDDHPQYLRRARETNRVLGATFGDVYDALRCFFEECLNEPVELARDLALPGFHIFEFDGQTVQHGTAYRAHFDFQWMHALPGQVPEAVVSFTVAVHQPTGGAALDLWPLRYQQAFPQVGSVVEYARTHQSRRVVYRLGEAVVHDGYILHAIGNSEHERPLGRRVTLQGHGARLGARWALYW